MSLATIESDEGLSDLSWSYSHSANISATSNSCNKANKQLTGPQISTCPQAQDVYNLVMATTEITSLNFSSGRPTNWEKLIWATKNFSPSWGPKLTPRVLGNHWFRCRSRWSVSNLVLSNHAEQILVILDQLCCLERCVRDGSLGNA